MKTTKITLSVITIILVSFILLVSCEGPSNSKKPDTPSTSPSSSFVPTDFSNNNGSGNLNAQLWYHATVPTSEAKDSEGNMNIGWKDYNVYWKGELVGSLGTETTQKGGKSKSKYAGTITESVYQAEYSNRDQILNRVYNKSTGKYEADDDIWDLTSLKAEFGITE